MIQSDCKTSPPGNSRSGCRIGAIGILLALPLSIYLFFLVWKQPGVDAHFNAKHTERSAVVALIQSGKLHRTAFKTDNDLGIAYSQILLPNQYASLARDRVVKVAEKEDMLEIAFPIKTWQFGDGQLFFVYRADTRLVGKVELKSEDFLLFHGASFFHAERMTSNWYQVSEEW